MTDKLFHVREISEIYGLSIYEARTIMERVPKINVSRGDLRPRWVARQSDIETFLLKRSQRHEIEGLDKFGKILRRR